MSYGGDGKLCLPECCHAQREDAILTHMYSLCALIAELSSLCAPYGAHISGMTTQTMIAEPVQRWWMSCLCMLFKPSPTTESVLEQIGKRSLIEEYSYAQITLLCICRACVQLRSGMSCSLMK
jgi:hypothetical protein